MLAAAAVLAATVYAFAQMSPGGPMGMHAQMQQGGMMGQMHSQMMQGQDGMHGGHGNARQYGRSWRNAWSAICRDRYTDPARARCLRDDPRDRSNSAIRSQDGLVKGQH